MRIPLDYYRILGLPIQATAQQLKQAHRDRTLQLPRREYSEIVIEARKSLIDEAYELLSDPDQRQTYDAEFLSRSHSLEAISSAPVPVEVSTEIGEAALRSLAAEPPTTVPPTAEPYTPTIAIDERQFVGALLILLELGEYELVIRLGRPFLTSGHESLDNGRYGDPERVLEDIVLTLALACLELGREQWQQNQYENAAESLETGQELLLGESAFPAIRAELQSDLYKLRPYRVLELVARPLEQSKDRLQGIALLKAMLRDRGGIDGAGDDLSGLSTDDFLRFIQQLRGYLTTEEQQTIFEAEVRRPSAVAAYLAVYALLARGFAGHKPNLVQRARQLLGQLSTRQDVHLEQAVCALLLGQAEEAGQALELSQEYEPLAFIREHSQDSPDLLPGLCLYTERWLREEVFTHFRDLANQSAALKDYFADRQVQAYLEEMTLAPPTQPTPATFARDNQASLQEPFPQPLQEPPFASTFRFTDGTTMASPMGKARPTTEGYLASEPEETVSSSDGGLSIAERVSQLSPEGQLEANGTSSSRRAPNNGLRPSPQVVSPVSPSPTPPSRPQGLRWDRVAGILVLGIIAMGALGFATVRTLSWVSAALTRPRLQRPALEIGLAAPPVEILPPPSPEEQISVNDIAETVVNNWLTAKRRALSENHEIDVLSTVLIEPALEKWRNRANGAQQNNWYFNYDHTIEILDVQPNDPGTDALTATVQVREVAEYYELGSRNLDESYDEILTMEYSLVRQNGEWFVKDMAEID